MRQGTSVRLHMMIVTLAFGAVAAGLGSPVSAETGQGPDLGDVPSVAMSRPDGVQGPAAQQPAISRQLDTTCFLDQIGDEIDQFDQSPAFQPRVDIVESCVDFITSTTVRFRTKVDNPTDPFSDPLWDYQGDLQNQVGWTVAPQRYPSAGDLLWTVNYGDVGGSLPGWRTFLASHDDLQVPGASVPTYCSGQGGFDGTWYSATIPVECIGFPEDFYFSTFSYYQTTAPGQLSDVGWYDGLPQFFEDGGLGPVILAEGLNPCEADVHVIGVRGSGEEEDLPRPENVGNGYEGASMGEVVSPFYEHLGGFLAVQGRTASWEGVTYPAVSVFEGLVLTLGDGYNESFNEGIRRLSDRWVDRQLRCPGQPVVLAGYSQGAHVVGNFLNTWAGGLEDLAAAMLFADPRFNPADPSAQGTFAATPNFGEGTINVVYRPSGVAGARPLFSSEVEGRINSYCLYGDLVCVGIGHATPELKRIHEEFYIDDVPEPYPPYGNSTRLAGAYASSLVRRWLQDAPAPTPRQSGAALVARLDGPDRARPGEQVTVYANGSYDELGVPLHYRFTYGHSGLELQSGPTPTVAVEMPLAGSVEVTVAVTASDGASVSSSHTINVDDTAPVPAGSPRDVTVNDALNGSTVTWRAPIDDGGASLAYRLVDAGTDEVLVVTADRRAVLAGTTEREVAVETLSAAGVGDRSAALAVGPSAVDPDAGAVQRLAGVDRRETAALLAVRASGAVGAGAVVVTRDDAYADALSASALAGAHGAPVLLAGRDQLGSATTQAVTELGAERAFVIGGVAALSEAVVDELEDLGLEVQRIAGETRYATAAAVARTIGGEVGLLVLGDHADANRAWPDAVAASAVAASSRWPVLLTTGEALPNDTEAAILDLGLEHMVVVGGVAAVNEQLTRQVEGLGVIVTRIAGSDRFATSVAVAQAHVDGGASRDVVVVATGRNWPDALAGGPAAALMGGTLLLVDGQDTSSSPQSIGWLGGGDVEQVVLAGSPAAVSTHVADSIESLVGGR